MYPSARVYSQRNEDFGAQPGGGDGDHVVPAPAQRIDQPPGVPRAGGAEDPGPEPLGHD